MEELRERLKDYYGTAAFCGYPVAIIKLAEVEKAAAEELIALAKEAGLL